MRPTLRPLQADDLPRLNGWLGQPHVAQWWDAEPFDDDDLADPQTRAWVAEVAGRPFAYVQDYAVHGFGPHLLEALPLGARGIDLFIGEPDLVGLGLGTALVVCMRDRLFAEGAPALGIDPHPDNARAIAVYGKAGFRPFAAPAETPWGPALPMRCDPPALTAAAVST